METLRKELIEVQYTEQICEEALSGQSTQQATGYSMDEWQGEIDFHLGYLGH